MARVLISENSDKLSDAWRDALVQQGHEVSQAHDGREAVLACQAEDFEVVITDMSLPDVNGILLSGQISTLQPDVRIIAVSGELTEAMVDDELDGEIPFCARFLSKPVCPELLTETVDELVRYH